MTGEAADSSVPMVGLESASGEASNDSTDGSARHEGDFTDVVEP